MVDPEWNTEFHMPDSFYDPPDEEESCERCENAGCHLCNAQMAYDDWADKQIQNQKEEK
jgi:hypothetical protein